MAADRQRVSLSMAGAFCAFTPDGAAIEIKNRKARCILAYMVLNGASRSSRESLASMLWSESPEHKAKGSLRASLKQLADCLNRVRSGLFYRDDDNAYLDIKNISCDVQEIYDRAASGEVELIIETRFSPENIMMGAEKEDSAFAAWLHVIRKSWRDKFVDALERQCKGFPSPKSARAAHALICIERNHEGAHRHLIAHAAMQGNTADAHDIYNSLFTHLADEYDAEPSQATIDLIGDVKMGRFDPASLGPPRPESTLVAAATPVLGLAEDTAPFHPPAANALAGVAAMNHPGVPCIGVAPFQQSGLWRSETYMIDGFRRDLIAALVRFREWIVMEAPEPAATPSPAGFAEPDYLLEGGYQDNVGSVRLTITLRGRASHAFLWSEPLEFGFDQWLQAQDEIVRRIAIALNISVSHHHMRRAAQERALPLDLYGRWLQGQELLLQWRSSAHAEATEIFQQIIAERPDFARAYSSLAQIGNADSIVNVGRIRTISAKRENVRLAKRAVDADPLDSRGHLALAWARMLNAQFSMAEMELEQASALNGNDPWTLVSVALGWAFCGDIDSSKRYSRQALQLGLRPTPSHWAYQAVARYLAGDDEGCVEAAEEAEEAQNSMPAWKAAALVRLGQLEDAKAAASRFRDIIRSEWSSESKPTDGAILDWLAQCVPIRSEDARREFRGELIAAGFDSI